MRKQQIKDRIKKSSYDGVTDESIEEEEAKTLSDGLKVNTTLTSLNLYSEEERRNERERRKEKKNE